MPEKTKKNVFWGVVSKCYIHVHVCVASAAA